MAITVFLTPTRHQTYEKGRDWFVDDHGYMYVRDEAKKHIATFHRKAWLSVASGEPRLSEAEAAEHETRRIEAEARIAESLKAGSAEAAL